MISLLLGSSGFQGVNCVEPGQPLALGDLDGRPRAATWRPLAMERYDPEGWEGRSPTGDFLWHVSSTLVMSERAVEALSDLLEEYGEVLPLADSEGMPLYAWNVTRVIDALDEAHCVVDRFPASGRIMYIWEHVFFEERVRGVDAFRLPPDISRSIYVGDGFVARVRAAGLQGLKFESCWSAEGGPVRREFWATGV